MRPATTAEPPRSPPTWSTWPCRATSASSSASWRPSCGSRTPWIEPTPRRCGTSVASGTTTSWSSERPGRVRPHPGASGRAAEGRPVRRTSSDSRSAWKKSARRLSLSRRECHPWRMRDTSEESGESHGQRSISTIRRLYINRELSWLEFNDRVLREGLAEDLPLLERLKFLAIVSSNLDEFFMVRVAGLLQQRAAGVRRRDPSGMSPGQQLEQIGRRAHRMVAEQGEGIAQRARTPARAGTRRSGAAGVDAAQRTLPAGPLRRRDPPGSDAAGGSGSRPDAAAAGPQLLVAVVVEAKGGGAPVADRGGAAAHALVRVSWRFPRRRG